jgi:hypothetical protein
MFTQLIETLGYIYQGKNHYIFYLYFHLTCPKTISAFNIMPNLLLFIVVNFSYCNLHHCIHCAKLIQTWLQDTFVSDRLSTYYPRLQLLLQIENSSMATSLWYFVTSLTA